MVAISLKESCSVTETKKVTFRSYKNFNEAELNQELSRVPFHVAHIFDDMDGRILGTWDVAETGRWWARPLERKNS